MDADYRPERKDIPGVYVNQHSDTITIFRGEKYYSSYLDSNGKRVTENGEWGYELPGGCIVMKDRCGLLTFNPYRQSGKIPSWLSYALYDDNSGEDRKIIIESPSPFWDEVIPPDRFPFVKPTPESP